MRDKSKCFYKNETYNKMDQLKASQLVGTCNGHCYCAEGIDEDPAEFKCASLDCPEFFGYSQHSGSSKKCKKNNFSLELDIKFSFRCYAVR